MENEIILFLHNSNQLFPNKLGRGVWTDDVQIKEMAKRHFAEGAEQKVYLKESDLVGVFYSIRKGCFYLPTAFVL